MILTAESITRRELVVNPNAEGVRDTTYDATVGEIVQDGKTVEGDSYVLPARGIVWVVSAEKFNLPKDVTGLATLRTTWTHNGILALNVGIVDPGWNSHLATAVVNFSNGDFVINRGQAFLRIIFFGHSETNAALKSINRAKYIEMMRNNCEDFGHFFEPECIG
jgi:deoxycytidine triphosphate deaminase